MKRFGSAWGWKGGAMETAIHMHAAVVCNYNRLQMKNIILILGLTIFISCNTSTEKNEKLVRAVQDSTITIRGNLIEIAKNDFRFDYYDGQPCETEKPTHILSI